MKVPKGQILWVTYRNEHGKILWAITSDALRSVYILWKANGDDLTKYKTAPSPAKFNEILKGEKR